MKKLICLCLVLAMLLPCLSACSSIKTIDSAKEDKKESAETTDPTDTSNGGMPVEDLGVTEAFSRMLANAVILMLDSVNCCTKGAFLTNEGGAMPVLVGDVVYIPVGFVARQFGGTVTFSQENKLVDIQVLGVSLQIAANAQAMTVNGENVPIEGAEPEQGDIMIPADAFCEAVGKEMYIRDNLVVLGDNFEAAAQDVPEETVKLTMDGVKAQLESITNGITPVFESNDPASTSKLTREEWGSIALRFDIDPSLAPWRSAKDKLVAVTGNMFIEDVNITPGANDAYECSMKVYNYLNYTYGAVEVYDANDQLYHVYRIKPFEGQKASIVGYFSDLIVMAVDISQAVYKQDWEELGYKSALNSNIQDVKFTVPAGGYAIVTNNPLLSDNVAAFNLIHALVEISATVGDLSAATEGSAEIKDALKESVMDDLLQDTTALHTLAAEFEAFIDQCGQLDSFDIGGYAKTAGAYFMDMLGRIDIDFGTLLSAGYKGLDVGVEFAADQFCEKLFPPGQIAMKGWEISANLSNMVCMFMDMNNASRARPLMLQTCNWKAAYAQILRDYDTLDSYTFMTGYLDNNMIPELFVMRPGGRMSMVHIYSYQNDKVIQLKDPLNGENIYTPYGTYGYYELLGCLGRSSMSMGVSSLQYLEVMGDTFVIKHNFIDDELAEPAKVTYTYNDNQVSKFWYDYKIEKVKNSYDERHIVVDAYACYELTEGNIQTVFEN